MVIDDSCARMLRAEPNGSEAFSPLSRVIVRLHEALLNVAFEASAPFWLLCPYDLEAQTGEVIEEARRAHRPSK
jgi:hypothetical protein